MANKKALRTVSALLDGQDFRSGCWQLTESRLCNGIETELGDLGDLAIRVNTESTLGKKKEDRRKKEKNDGERVCIWV